MIERGFGVALYRIRSTFRRRWAGYLSLVVLVGLVGGLGLGSLAAARRTQSSFSTFLAATNPSDLLVSIYSGNSVASDNPTYSPRLTQAIARLPGVLHVAPGLERDGRATHRRRFAEDQRHRAGVSRRQCQRPLLHPGPHGGDRGAPGVPAASRRDRDGAGRWPSSSGLHVGQVIPFGFYSNVQQGLPGFGTKAVPPALRMNMKIVGLASLNSEIVEDDVDVLPTFIPLTPAFTEELLAHRASRSPGP